MGLICLADALNVNNQKDEAVKLMKQALELAKRQKQSPKSIMRIQKHLQKITKGE
jgi:predicted GNAT family N-acyltransferase